MLEEIGNDGNVALGRGIPQRGTTLLRLDESRCSALHQMLDHFYVTGVSRAMQRRPSGLELKNVGIYDSFCNVLEYKSIIQYLVNGGVV